MTQLPSSSSNVSGVDAVSAMLDGHRARGSYLLRCVMAVPWSVRIEDRAAAVLLVQLRGETSVVHGSQRNVLRPGDVAVVKGPQPYVLADQAGRAPTATVEPGQICRVIDPSAEPMEFGPTLRSWGNSADGECAFLAGTYELASQVTGRLLASVPDVVVLRAEEWDAPAVALLAEEITREAPGQDVVLDRLVDLVLISTLREWFARNPDAAPAWWHAQRDSVIASVLRLMHERPGQPWTIEALAGAVSVSRATLARRFTELVGQAPMSYLAEWRLSVACDRLSTTNDTVETIAGQVGYANAFAFSTAFKRHFGASPRRYRQQASA